MPYTSSDGIPFQQKKEKNDAHETGQTATIFYMIMRLLWLFDFIALSSLVVLFDPPTCI